MIASKAAACGSSPVLKSSRPVGVGPLQILCDSCAREARLFRPAWFFFRREMRPYHLTRRVRSQTSKESYMALHSANSAFAFFTASSSDKPGNSTTWRMRPFCRKYARIGSREMPCWSSCWHRTAPSHNLKVVPPSAASEGAGGIEVICARLPLRSFFGRQERMRPILDARR